MLLIKAMDADTNHSLLRFVEFECQRYTCRPVPDLLNGLFMLREGVDSFNIFTLFMANQIPERQPEY